jgi:uncharacterized protein with PQ loop repeat
MLADAAALVATVLAIVSLLPQILRLRRLGNGDGVSPTWAALGAVTNVGWFAYLTREALWASVPAPVFVATFYYVTLYYLRKAGRNLRRGLVSSAFWAPALAVSLAGGGWTFLGIVLGSSVILQVTPGVWTAYRTYLPRGISPGTWTILLIEALLWGYYGAFYADAPILIFSVTTTLASALMLARYIATRHRWIEEWTPA